MRTGRRREASRRARRADVNAQDAKGRTALHVAIEKEYDPALLTWLVAYGASADIEGRDGVSARLRASRKRNRRYLAALG